jgi:hypothetical protein
VSLSHAENCGRKLYVPRAAEDHSEDSCELILVRQHGNAGNWLDWKAELTAPTVQLVDVGKSNVSCLPPEGLLGRDLQNYQSHLQSS